jgi:type III restriction enzyme
VDEWDVANDKESALALVDSYLGQIGREGEELKRIVHLYRDVIIGDLRGQVENHIEDESHSRVYLKSGFVRFRAYTKTVLARDGILHFKERVPKSDVPRYLFEGFAKSLIFKQVPFDSAPEKDFAGLLERDDLALKWIRPPDGDVPISYRGRSYNPDFIVETADRKYLIEVKARNELQPRMDDQVQAKAQAAIRWCQAASGIAGTKPWEYKLIPDEVIQPSSGLAFVLSQAVRVAVPTEGK